MTTNIERRIFHIYKGVANPFSGDQYKFKLEVPRGQVVDTEVSDEYGHTWIRRVDTRKMDKGWNVEVSEGWKPDRKDVPFLGIIHFTESLLDRVAHNPDTDGFQPEKTYIRNLRGWRNGWHVKSLFGVGFGDPIFRDDRDVVRAEYWLAWKARQIFRRG